MKERCIIKKSNNTVVSLIALVSISSMVCAAYGWVGQKCATLQEVLRECPKNGPELEGGCTVREHPKGACKLGLDVCFQLDVPNDDAQVQVDTFKGNCVDSHWGGRTKCEKSEVILSFIDYANCY